MYKPQSNLSGTSGSGITRAVVPRQRSKSAVHGVVASVEGSVCGRPLNFRPHPLSALAASFYFLALLSFRFIRPIADWQGKQASGQGHVGIDNANAYLARRSAANGYACDYEDLRQLRGRSVNKERQFRRRLNR